MGNLTSIKNIHMGFSEDTRSPSSPTVRGLPSPRQFQTIRVMADGGSRWQDPLISLNLGATSEFVRFLLESEDERVIWGEGGIVDGISAKDWQFAIGLCI